MADVPEDLLSQDVYSLDELTREIRQSEIISDVAQYIYDASTESVEEIKHAFTIVASQDCDLLWDFESRERDNKGKLTNILLYEAKSVEQARSRIGGADLWKRVIQNQDDRYHYFEPCPSRCEMTAQGLPGLIVDFKRFLSLPISDLYRQIQAENGAKRRCRLMVSYREHFQSRAAFFMQRVMLPRPHAKPDISKAT